MFEAAKGATHHIDWVGGWAVWLGGGGLGPVGWFLVGWRFKTWVLSKLSTPNLSPSGFGVHPPRSGGSLSVLLVRHGR